MRRLQLNPNCHIFQVASAPKSHLGCLTALYKPVLALCMVSQWRFHRVGYGRPAKHMLTDCTDMINAAAGVQQQ